MASEDDRKREALAVAALLLLARRGTRALGAAVGAAAVAAHDEELPLSKARQKVAQASETAISQIQGSAAEAAQKDLRRQGVDPAGGPGPKTAATLGASLALQWEAVVRRLAEDGTPTRYVYGEAAHGLAPAIERTAVTETHAAWNREVSSTARTRPRAMKRWNAVLDVRTCVACSNLHGETIPAGEDFPGGDPPLHARCRCFLELILP